MRRCAHSPVSPDIGHPIAWVWRAPPRSAGGTEFWAANQVLPQQTKNTKTIGIVSNPSLKAEDDGGDGPLRSVMGMHRRGPVAEPDPSVSKAQ